jgi:hypothetical protein
MRIILDPVRSEVKANGLKVFLPPLEFEMFRLVRKAKHGISPMAIFSTQYQLDPNGGPVLGRKVIHQRKRQINRKIKPLGLAIMPHKNGNGCVYELHTTQCGAESAKNRRNAQWRLFRAQTLCGGRTELKSHLWPPSDQYGANGGRQTTANIFRYITQADLQLYLNAGWDCRYIGIRGDDLACFLASFRCCERL